MSMYLKNNASGPVRQTDSQELLEIRKSILQIVLVIASMVGTLAYFSNISGVVQEEAWAMVAVETVVYAAVLLITAVPRLPYHVRLHTLLLMLFLMSVADLAKSGLSGEGRLFFMAFAILSVLLLSFRTGMWMFGVSIVTVTIVAALMVMGVIPVPTMNAIDDSGSTTAWLTGGAIYVMLTLLAMSAIILLVRRLEAILMEQKRLTGDLEKERQSLEERVKERTAVLEKQAALTELSASFMQGVSKLAGQQELLDFTTRYFLENFGIHNIVIGTIDTSGEYLVPVGVTGQMAQTYVEQIQKIRLHQPGSVGDLIAKAVPRVVVNANEETSYFRYSGLGDLYSLVVLPLQVNVWLSGAILLLNSIDRETSNEDLQLYQTIAGQLTIALERSRLLDELRGNLEEMKASSRQQTQKSWRTYLRAANQAHSFRYDREKVESGALNSDSAQQAARQGQVVVTRLAGEENDGKEMTHVAVPILLRDQTLGVIDLRFEGNAVSKEMLALIEGVTKRLAVALEAARLMEQAQNRAEREHLVSGIGSQIRAQSDIDSILKTAAVEIGRSLGVSEVLVQLRTDQAAS